MRSQLLRRSADLKKNVSGSQKYLDVLREMSAVVSDSSFRKFKKPPHSFRVAAFKEVSCLKQAKGARSEHGCDLACSYL